MSLEMEAVCFITLAAWIVVSVVLFILWRETQYRLNIVRDELLKLQNARRRDEGAVFIIPLESGPEADRIEKLAIYTGLERDRALEHTITTGENVIERLAGGGKFYYLRPGDDPKNGVYEHKFPCSRVIHPVNLEKIG